MHAEGFFHSAVSVIALPCYLNIGNTFQILRKYSKRGKLGEVGDLSNGSGIKLFVTDLAFGVIKTQTCTVSILQTV